MSRSLAIVGSGTAELVLGFALLERGHSVTVVTEWRAEQIAGGRLRSLGASFRAGRSYERKLGIDHWDLEAFYGHRIELDFRDDSGDRVFGSIGEFHDGVGAIVDPRFEHSVWLLELARRGAEVRHAAPTLALLEELAARHDRVFVGSEGATHFAIDEELTFPRLPSRILSAVVVDCEWHRQDWTVSFIPGYGEIAGMPLLSVDGREARAIFVRGLPGSPLDSSSSAEGGGERVLAATKKVLKRFHPREFETIQHSALVDANAYDVRETTPHVRQPIARLPSGRFVHAIGDAFVSLDPITGHALTPTLRATEILAEAIDDSSSGELDEAWSRATARAVHEAIRPAYELEAALLVRPPHVVELLRAATHDRELADEVAAAISDPGGARCLVDAASARARLSAMRENEFARVASR